MRLNFYPLEVVGRGIQVGELKNLHFHPLEVCFATATHNFKWVGITFV